MKKGTIYAYHQQIQTWEKTGNILAYFHRGKIQEFYKEYGLRINTIYDEVLELQKEYFENEDTGNEVIIKLQDNKPILKAGKAQQDYNKAMTELMNMQISNLRLT
jgi:hypothetical protein